ncbi:hypothetical protein AB0469_38860 [Streptomyces sp. NPDC093801]|uniref:hypothetical protein n=1 Tax=Streptomyces sp. NPDC093801 TaxID=3155203 RepID=UPI00344FB69D
MSSPVFVYDTGMLIALERGDRSAGLLHRSSPSGATPRSSPCPCWPRHGDPAGGRR